MSGKGAAMAKQLKVVKAWGGFCDGTLHIWPTGSTWMGELAVYSTRTRARKAYKDVRRIEIREVSQRKAGSK